MARVLATGAALILLLSSIASAQVVSALRFSVSVGEYFGEAYTSLPQNGGSFVFFAGEPISLVLSVANSDSESAHEMVTSADDPASELVLTAFRDRQAIELKMSVTPEASLYDAGSVTPVEWNRRIRLDPLVHVEWRAKLLDPALEPGVYVLERSLRASDELSRPIPVVNYFAFEVRAPTPASEPELLRRQGFRELVNSQYDSAEAIARRLLALHPNSSQARVLLGDVAEARQKEYMKVGNLPMARESFRQATDSYQRALTLLEAGTDALLLRPNEAVSSHVIEGLRTRVRAMRTP